MIRSGASVMDRFIGRMRRKGGNEVFVVAVECIAAHAAVLHGIFFKFGLIVHRFVVSTK